MRIAIFAAVMVSISSIALAQKVSNVDELLRAVDAVKTPGARIVLAGGVYFLDKPIVLTPQHSGLTIEAAPGASPLLSGGRRVEHWHPAKLNNRDCWAADGVFVRELWINGDRAIRARQPNTGEYLKVKESPDATDNWETGVTRFRFDGDDIPPGPFAYGAEAIVMSRWVESRLPLREIDPATHLASFSRKSQWRIEANDPYWLEGDPRWFDEPGEFYLDRDVHTIYYLPRPGEQIDKIEAFVPALTHLLELRGSPSEGKFIANLTIRGLGFAHTEWMLPDPVTATTPPVSGGFTQAAIPVPAAVQGSGLRNVAIDRCTFKNMGTWALELGRASQHCHATHSKFIDLGAGGIMLGSDSIPQKQNDLSFANEIADCTIERAGCVFPSAVGIWIGQSFDNRVHHNDIHDLFYSGISAGWSWGYDDSLNRGNIIEKNLIHHIGQRSDGDGPILADMGAIYLLGGRRGTVIRNNVLHDINGVRIAWGVYLDEGCCDVVVENNLVYRTSHGGLHLHYGRDNMIRNNIFALGKEVQLWRSREEDHRSWNFERNIVYWKGDSPLIRTSSNNIDFDRNIYAGLAMKDFRAGDLTWEQWRAVNEDKHSILFEGSIFADVDKDDFRVKPNIDSAIGFVPFNWNDVGPRNP
jgi:parallel beta-helix repeat protein